VASLTVKTGRDNIDNTRQITEYNGADTIGIWAEPVKVEGTDGMQFAPGVLRNMTLKTFQPDLMRVAKMVYASDSEAYGISLLRFKLSSDTFSINPSYYMNTEGLINLSLVAKYSGAPVRLSKPHFLGADPSLLSAVVGMNPDPQKHDTFIDVEPFTGIVMNASKRAQINFEVAPSEFYRENITDTVMPIAWFEQNGAVTQDLASQFKGQLYFAMDLRDNLPLIFLAIGAPLFVLGSAFLYRAGRRKVTN
jgi:lysosome membrane protein 2